MFKTSFKFKGTCPQHTRFNPSAHGMDGVKGGCSFCENLAMVSRYLDKARYYAKAFEEETNGIRSASNAVKESGEGRRTA